MMVCLKAEESNKIVKICALLHDIGKPSAREVIPFEVKSSNSNRVMPKSGLKVRFHGHEGMSTFLAIEILIDLENEGVISKDEKIRILRIISMHGTLFNSIDENGNMKKPEQVFAKFRKDEVKLYNDFISQVKNDSTGRFFVSKDGRKNHAFRLQKEIFTEEQFLEYHKDKENSIKDGPTITALIGPPCSGKSTYIKETKANEVIISRDDVLMEYGKNRFGKEATYSEIWKQLTELNLQVEVDNYVQMFFKEAVKAKQDIFIDMTNMSRKSRRKWLMNVTKDYNKKAIVFFTEYNTLIERNKIRSKEGKVIPEKVIDNMIKGFMVPGYDELNEIEYKF